MNQINREELARFCGHLQYRLKLLRQTRLHMDRLLASRFNVFGYIQPDENQLSDIIADLLEPNGAHGQGDAFLKAFLATLGPAAPVTWAKCQVFREPVTSTIQRPQRRMDILIELDAFGIAIENKPWAGEQHEQIHDYTTHLQRRFAGKFIILYLSPDGAAPGSISAEQCERMRQAGQLMQWAYNRDFCAWLMRCFQICAAKKMRWFLSDLLTYSQQQFSTLNPSMNP